VRVSDTATSLGWPVILSEMSDLVTLDVVPNEVEAELICGILREAGIPAMQRLTTGGAGATDGFPVGGAREILVRAEQLERARKTLEHQERGGR
jgi:hypothetical protein